MKYLRQLCAATALIFALTLPVVAGEMGCPVVPPPPDPSMAAGDMHYPVTASDSATSEDASSVVESALELMRSVLFLF